MSTLLKIETPGRAALLVALLLAATVLGIGPAAAQRWITSWAASTQGPYPAGIALAQPDLKPAFPVPAQGARDQTFRIIVKPDAWSSRIRLRFSNAFGTKPVTFDGVFVGFHTGGATVMPQSNRPVQFGGKKTLTVPPGQVAWSDQITLAYVSNPNAAELVGRRLAVSFHVAGETGPMSWHALAMQTSYVTAPGAGALGELEDESAFPNATTSTFFLDALDVQAAADTRVVVAAGEDLTDGLGATPGGDDRWPDVLSRRLRAAGIRASVVDAGIAGSFVIPPTDTSPEAQAGAGSALLSRLDRDVLGLSGVTHVIWLAGINDIGGGGRKDWEAVRDATRLAVERLRAKLPGLRVIAGTLPSTLNTTSAPHRMFEVELKRKALNRWIRDNGDLFDAVIDFDAATTDPQSGELRPDFVPFSSGGPGDRMHPNRAGYLAMGNAVDLGAVAAGPRPRPRTTERTRRR